MAVLRGTGGGERLHEEAVVVDVVDDVRILLNDVGESLRIDQGDRQLFVQRVVVPVDFCQREDSGAGLVPSALSRETPKEDGGRRGEQGTFLVDIQVVASHVHAADAALSPEKGLVPVDRDVGTANSPLGSCGGYPNRSQS